MYCIKATKCRHSCKVIPYCKSCCPIDISVQLAAKAIFTHIELINDAVAHGREVWLKSMIRGVSFVPKSSRAFIIKCALNYIKHDYRHWGKRIVLFSNEITLDCENSIFPAVSNLESCDDIEHCVDIKFIIESLPADLYQLFQWIGCYGLDVKEYSIKFNINYRKVYRMMDKLRWELENNYGFTPPHKKRAK